MKEDSDLVVYDGHFWVRIESILGEKRKEELKSEVDSSDRLLLVKDEIWTRIEKPHPTKRQKLLFKADWKPEDLGTPGTPKMPKIKE